MVTRYITICALALSLAACGKKEEEKAKFLNVGGFESYVQAFEQESESQGKPYKVNNLVIEFGDLSNPLENGLCEVSGDQTPKITIDKTNWETLGAKQRESLIFHEMGHCVLRRVHKSTTSGGVAVSIMNPYTLSEGVYDANRGVYVQELFSTTNEY